MALFVLVFQNHINQFNKCLSGGDNKQAKVESPLCPPPAPVWKSFVEDVGPQRVGVSGVEAMV